MELLKQLHPFKIEYRDFVRRYLELKSNENRFFDEIPENEITHEKLSKDIIDYFYEKKGMSKPKIIFGNKRIFAGEGFMKDLEHELLVIRKREIKWEEYIKIKFRRYLVVIRKEKFFKNL